MIHHTKEKHKRDERPVEMIRSLEERAASQRKKADITQAIERYVQGEPETQVFTFFLPTTQDLDLIKQAAARTSLATGKQIHLCYPTNMISLVKEEEEDA